MKKKFLLIVSALLFLGAGASKLFAAPSELDIYNNLNIYSNAGYYPGVVVQAELLENNYPESVFIVEARIAKGQALTILKRYEEAEETFAAVLSSIHFGAADYAKCWYYLGLAYYSDGDYTNALNAFHTTCDVEQRENKIEYYPSALLYAGRINYFMELYPKAVPLFEYVVTNGGYFSKPEYDEALQKLLFSYNSSGDYANTIKLYDKLEASNYSDKVFAGLTIYAADAYEKTGDVNQAYQILNKNQNDDFKEMLSIFRLNLGVAAYSKKDYAGALEYFDLAEESSSLEVLLPCFIYRQKIALDKGGKKAVGQVEEALKQKEEAIFAAAPDIPGLADSYWSLMLRCKAFDSPSKDQVLSAYNSIKKPSAKDAYTCAFIVRQRDSLLAEEILAPFSSDTQCAKLYAALLAKNGKYELSAAQYSSLAKNRKLDGNGRLEYAKVLYCLKNWRDSYDQALASNKYQGFYLAGLCKFNLAEYRSAYEQLTKYVNSKGTISKYQRLANYYRGLCSYKISDYKNAYKIFAAFSSDYKERDSFAYRACELAAKSALMDGDLKNAAFMAEKMIDASMTQVQKEDAVIYCSEIYTDCREYDKAISILQAQANDGSDFAVRCILASAEVFVKKGDLDSADSAYKKITVEAAGKDNAEYAAYRSGEIFYAAQKYDQAQQRFTKYLYDYVNGKYTDAAYYFSGDCNMQTGDYDLAIMQNTTLVTKYPKSIYSYAAYKNLLQAYYYQENYRDALSTARNIVRDYNDQALADGIGQRVVELERIVSGTDRTIVEKNSEYERAGKAASKKGRIAGSELVQLYAEHGMNDEALALALELLNYQKDGDEMYYAAQNADFLAGYYYKSGESKKAAEYYLKAAEYYRSSGQDDSDKAAAALYSATDSFIAAGLRGDAEATAKALVELYPDTKQAGKVMNLLK